MIECREHSATVTHIRYLSVIFLLEVLSEISSTRHKI